MFAPSGRIIWACSYPITVIPTVLSNGSFSSFVIFLSDRADLSCIRAFSFGFVIRNMSFHTRYCHWLLYHIPLSSITRLDDITHLVCETQPFEHLSIVSISNAATVVVRLTTIVTTNRIHHYSAHSGMVSTLSTADSRLGRLDLLLRNPKMCYIRSVVPLGVLCHMSSVTSPVSVGQIRKHRLS